MRNLRYIELLKLKRDRKLIKDSLYSTESGIYVALSDRSFTQYTNALGPEIIISETEPSNPKVGTIWIDIS